MSDPSQGGTLADQREPADVPIGKESLNRRSGRHGRPIKSGTSTVAELEISLFGGFRVRCGTDRHIELSGRKDCALLGYLAISPGVPVSREKLAALLWGNSGDRQARDSLKQAVLRLRKSFGSLHPLPVLTDRASLTLDRAGVAVDGLSAWWL
jgi:two-component SAPR family response regulator